MANLNILIAFLAGMLSILSPCIIPVLPGFIAYLSGISIQHALEKNSRRQTIISSIFFSLGFNIIFMFFGLLVGNLSQFLVMNQALFQEIGGIIIISFGVIQTGLVRLNFLQKEPKIADNSVIHNYPHYLKSLLFGMMFAFSWSPCFGPIIGAIFTLAATSGTFYQSLFFFIFYALGFTLPLILLATFLTSFNSFFKHHRNFYRYTNLIAGILLIIIGFLMFTNSLAALVNWLNFLYTQNKLLFF